MFHNLADMVHGKKGDAYKESTRLYKMFLFFRGSETSEKEKAWVSIFDSVGLIFLLFYYFAGIYLQHIAVY